MNLMEKPNLSVADSFIFDCDGVIFDSNQLKSDAFVEVLEIFKFDQKIKNEFINYHQTNGGISRYVKFKYLIENILNKPFDETLYRNLLSEYSNKCVELYNKASLVPGIESLITNSKVPMFVASGSDEEELKKVFKNRGIDKYFEMILGSPKTKNECVKIISEKLGTSQKIILFGDSYADYVAAQEIESNFVFVSQFSEAKEKMLKVCKDNNCPVITNFEECL